MVEVNYLKASPQHRLGGKAIDLAMYVVTFGIGWIIWSLVVWGQGQTPGKQIVKLRVYDKTKGTPVKWGHMALRESVVPMTLYVVLMLVVSVSTTIPVTEIAVGGVVFAYLTIFAIFLLDAFWILKGSERNRLVDLIVKTDVVNESI
jgi:uncharacterized RDD family membrane protein YckC